ncbi:MAG TPA: hypothetical protein PLM53_02885 [Spirochaetota bacterium]|nr:hypothetical protein [Spirochaetota bacterium]HPC42435.1 hypothetical protein [Spirochaetota bacterium]HPL18461.1 hypothetical protein [Spirochaetota bacterium]HQF06578.1 hypothetical protein [Spirochaetota bacterium]HQH96019.1 hypothetical protein [Spirochaetota bacterium]
MAIQKVNDSSISRGLIESMKQQGQETAKPEALKKSSKMQSFKEAAKGFKIDTKA